MWTRSADNSPSKLSLIDYCMIWSATMENAGAGSLMWELSLLGGTASVAGCRVVISYLQRGVVRRPRVILRRLSEINS